MLSCGWLCLSKIQFCRWLHLSTNVIKTNPLMKNCHFVVAPINCSDSTPTSKLIVCFCVAHTGHKNLLIVLCHFIRFLLTSIYQM